MDVTSVEPTPSPQATVARSISVAEVRGGQSQGWKGKLFWLLAVVGAFGAGWLFARSAIQTAEKEEMPLETGLGEREPSAVMVTVEPVTFRPVQRAVEGLGTLHGFEEVTISAQVEGLVRRLYFDVADRVKPGDVLLEIDPTDFELSVEQAERTLQVELAKLGFEKLPGSIVDLEKIPSVMLAQARMDKGRSRLERVRQLAATGAITAEELETASTDYRAAQAEYANQILLAKAGLATIRMKQTAHAVAQQQLADAQVRVPTPTQPLPGVADSVSYAVTQRSVAEGTLVRAGTEIGKLVIDQTLKLRLPVPERHSNEVRVGQVAEVRVAAFSTPFGGTVTRINPSVEPTTRTFEVEILVPNPGGKLKPGSFTKVAILTHLDAEAATVPLSALVNFAGVQKIFLAENGRARSVPVSLGIETTEWAEIVSPAVPRGAVVITSGQSVLAADAPVTVRTATKSEATQEPSSDRSEIAR